MTSSQNEFFDYLDAWLADLPTLTSKELFIRPEKTALLSVDLTNAFCKTGSLASPRAAALIPPATALMRSAWQSGVRQFLLLQDCHRPDALEFGAFAPHAVCGTAEAEAVDEIKALPSYGKMTILTKNAVVPDENTGLDAWLAERPELDTFIVVGDCTDICAYLLAMHLRGKANAYHLPWRVIVSENCVGTYDLPLETAQQIGAMPHPGDLLQRVFLYHMSLNGIEVVKAIN
jgi:nicotinamidase-related amidase